MPKLCQTLRVKLFKLSNDANEKLIFQKRLKIFYDSIRSEKISLVTDVGANKGQTIDFLLSLNSQCEIHAVGASQTLAKKHLPRANVIINKVRVSDAQEEKVFNENILNYTSTFEPVNKGSAYLKARAKVSGVDVDDSTTSRYKIQTTTLAKYISDLKFDQPVDVLKIDVEGHEFAVLQGFFQGTQSSSVKYIQLENHTDDMYSSRVPFHEIKKLLESKGYEIYTTIKHGFANLEEVVFKKLGVAK